MTDSTVVHIGENSPEQVAYKLLQTIASVEKKELHATSHLAEGHTVADRKWILNTYRECLMAVKLLGRPA